MAKLAKEWLPKFQKIRHVGKPNEELAASKSTCRKAIFVEAVKASEVLGAKNDIVEEIIVLLAHYSLVIKVLFHRGCYF